MRSSRSPINGPMSASPTRCSTIPRESASMAERLSALAAVYRPGNFGTLGSTGPGITIAERRPLAMVQVAGRGEGGAALRSAIEAPLGVALHSAATPPTAPAPTTLLFI